VEVEEGGEEEEVEEEEVEVEEGGEEEEVEENEGGEEAEVDVEEEKVEMDERGEEVEVDEEDEEVEVEVEVEEVEMEVDEGGEEEGGEETSCLSSPASPSPFSPLSPSSTATASPSEVLHVLTTPLTSTPCDKDKSLSSLPPSRPPSHGHDREDIRAGIRSLTTPSPHSRPWGPWIDTSIGCAPGKIATSTWTEEGAGRRGWGKGGVGEEELKGVREEAEEKLHWAIDEALRRYHHRVASRHAAMVGARRREGGREGGREEGEGREGE
jgi:hypothetical protein